MHTFAAFSGVARVAANVQRSAGLIEPFRLAYGVPGRLCAWPISATNVVVLSQPGARPTVGCPRDDKTQLLIKKEEREVLCSSNLQDPSPMRASEPINSTSMSAGISSRRCFVATWSHERQQVSATRLGAPRRRCQPPIGKRLS